MPRNQAPRNAFYFFMMYFKEKHGRKNSSLKDIADAASPHWKNMSKEQKKPYQDQAAREKNSIRASKLTSDGQDVDELLRKEQLEEIKIQDMKDDISHNIHMAFEAGRIQDELFFIIHVNTFCYCASLDRHYPAEIAITCFSLEDGVLPQNVFHSIIKSGPLPLGYASEAKLQSDKTHQLPPPLSGDGSNVEEVFTEMKLFLSTKLSGSKRYPPLYAHEKMIKTVQSILDAWCYDFEEERPLFKVYNLQYMFRALKNKVAKETVWPSDTYSAREIEKDVYDHIPSICCELHSIADVYVHCSRSITVRYAYIICDNCCADLHIILIPGAHVPDQALTPFSGTRSSSTTSLCSSKSSKLKVSIRDDDSDSAMSFSSKSEWDNQSIVSDSSNLSNDSDFPNLGMIKKKSALTNSQPQFSSADSRSLDQSSLRSYAGAMGKSIQNRKPVEVSKESGNASSTSSVTEFSIGRGRSNTSLKSDDDDFPALGVGGRGRLLGRGKRMN